MRPRGLISSIKRGTKANGLRQGELLCGFWEIPWTMPIYWALVSWAMKPIVQRQTTHWVNLRLTLHAKSSAMETPSGALTVHVLKNTNLPISVANPPPSKLEVTSLPFGRGLCPWVRRVAPWPLLLLQNKNILQKEERLWFARGLKKGRV